MIAWPRLGLVLLALLGTGRPADAQQTAARKDTATAAPAAAPLDTSLVPIPSSEIPTEADRAVTTVVEALTAVGSTARIDEILEGIPRLMDSLSREEDVTSLSRQGLLTRRGLSNLTLRWSSRERHVRDWQRHLKVEATTVDSVRDGLQRQLRRWRVTRDAHDSTTPPEAVARSIEIVIGLERVDSLLADRAQRVLDGELTLSKARTTIFAQQLALVAAQRQARRGLLRLDSPPLWRDPLGRTAPTLALSGGLTRAIPELRWFIDGHSVGLLVHVLLTLLLGLLALRNQRALRETGEFAVPTSSHYIVLRQPLASLTLVSIVLVMWLYPRAPLAVYDAALMLCALPLLALLPDLVPRDLLRPARLVIAYLVLQRLVTIASLGHPSYRLVQLALSASGAAMLWLGLRPGGVLHAALPGRWRPVLEQVSWLLLGAFVIAAISNLVGNVSLADALNAGVATSLFIGIVMRAVALVADVFVSEAVKRGGRFSRYLAQRGDRVDRILVGAVNVGAVVAWLVLTLQAFYLYAPLADQLGRILRASITIGAASLSVGKILTFFVVLWIGIQLARLLSGVLELDGLGRMDLRRGLAVTVGSLVRYALIAVAFLWAVAAVGIQLSDVAILGGALGVGIGFGLQNVVNNFVSGMLLAFERPVGVGDTVQVGPHIGDVKEIGIRASVIRTFDGAEVIVPNSELITKDVVNWTRTGTRRRFEVKVGTAYGTDPAKVLSILMDAAVQHPGVRGNPEPIAIFDGFGESSLDFVLRAWTDDPNWFKVRSDVAVAINEMLGAAGIEIPFPQRDLHVRSVSPEALRELGRSEQPLGEPG